MKIVFLFCPASSRLAPPKERASRSEKVAGWGVGSRVAGVLLSHFFGVKSDCDGVSIIGLVLV